PNWAGDHQGPGTGDQGPVTLTDTRSSVPDPRSLVRAYHLVNPDYWLPSISTTFHARDIFVPVAADLASGAQPERMGEPIAQDSLVTLPLSAPRVSGSGRGTTVVGQVVHIDRFGNIITNLPDMLLA